MGNKRGVVLVGTDGSDTLTGGAGNDLIDGRGGADLMTGARGDDIYYVDDAGDSVVEHAGEGLDEVRSTITYALAANVENLTLSGTAAINGEGNELDNRITGNDGANILSGLAGADFITGGAGNDRLDGGTGSDHLDGGLGNDVYVVDNPTDFIFERYGEGTDTVLSSVSFVLYNSELERLTLTGDAADGTGNYRNNVIYGNGVANRLDGMEGNDLIDGRGGPDTIVGGLGSDTLRGGAGNDHLSGDEGNDRMYGGRGADTLAGGAGNDRVSGGAGGDNLSGGEGADLFQFDAPLGTVDAISDFSAADDTIVLDRTFFSAISATGTLADTAFHAGTAAADADDRIIYDAATGNIYYDADGNGAGAQVLFAQVTAGLTLTSADFLIIA